MTKKRVKLHLGCGTDIIDGYINIDHVKMKGVDRVVNLNTFPYPFKANSVDEVYGKHIFEHFERLERVMEELTRICKNHARIKIIVPYFSGQGSFNNPDHKTFFTWRTFEFFHKDKHYSKTSITTLRRKIFFFSSQSFMRSRWYSLGIDFLINICPQFYQRFFCWIFPSSEIHYELRIEKEVNVNA